MEAAAQPLSQRTSRHQAATIFTTTLFDVVEAVQEEVSPDEEGLVTEVVADLFNSGRVRFAHNPEGLDVNMA